MPYTYYKGRKVRRWRTTYNNGDVKRGYYKGRLVFIRDIDFTGVNGITICGYPEGALSVETVDNPEMRSWWYFVRGNGNRLYSTIEENLKKIIYWAILGDDARVNQYKSFLASPGGSCVQLPEVPGFPSRNYTNDLYFPANGSSSHNGKKTTPDGALQFSARGTPLENEINRLCATMDMKISLEVNTRDILTTSYIAGQNGTFKLGGLRYLTTFILNNYGYIAGLGGNGGSTQGDSDKELKDFWYDIDYNLQTDYTRGKKGTDAVQLDLPFTNVTINNHGFIFGGGGGGSGSVVTSQTGKPSSICHLSTGGMPFGSGCFRIYSSSFRHPLWGTNGFRSYTTYFTGYVKKGVGLNTQLELKEFNSSLLPRHDRNYVRTPFLPRDAVLYCYQHAYKEEWLAGSNGYPYLPAPRFQWKWSMGDLKNIATGGWFGEDGYVTFNVKNYTMGKLVVEEQKDKSVIGDHRETHSITRISTYPCNVDNSTIECTRNEWKELLYYGSNRATGSSTSSWDGNTTARNSSFVGAAGAALRVVANNLIVNTPGENSYGRLGDYTNF